MKQYPAYPAYKTTGCDWFPEIPSHWGIDRAKWSISSCQNGVWGAEPDGDDDLVCIRVADFDRQSLRVSTEKLTMRSIAEKDRRNRLLKNGDLLLEKSGGGEQQLVGAVVEFNQPFPAVTSNFIARMVASDGMNSRFLVYLHSHLYSGRVNFRSIKQTTGIQNLDSQAYLDEPITYPPLDEQKTIACFLDFKTAQIDALIAKKKALLDKLAEKRSALISHAVTKGLDPSVPMKDSGVAWLGDIPAHWKIKRLKFSTDLINNKVNVEDSSLSYLGLEHIESWTGRRIDGEISNSEGLASSFAAGDVLFGKLRPYLAKVHLAQHNGLISSEALVIRSKDGLLAEFLKYYMLSRDFINIVDSSTYGSKMPRASWDFIGNLPILLPMVDEQENIISYLDENFQKFDEQKNRIDLVINHLQEYRSALITNAVTGKIDVRDFQIPPPAEVQETL